MSSLKRSAFSDRAEWQRCHRPTQVVLATLLATATLGYSPLSPASSPQVTISPAASEHFARGVSELTSKQAGHFLRAHRAFQQAYDESPAWQILGNLGIAADALQRDREAIEAYEGYLKNGAGELDADEIAQFQMDIGRLRSGSAQLTIEVTQGPVFVIDTRQQPSGKPVINRYGPFHADTTLIVREGKHSLHAERAGWTAPDWKLVAPAGSNAQHHFKMQPVDAVRKPSPVRVAQRPQDALAPLAEPTHTGAYWSWGVAAVTAGASVGLYMEKRRLQAKAKGLHDINCEPGPPPPGFDCEHLALDRHAAYFGTGAAASASVSAAFLIAGSVLYWRFGNDDPPQANAFESNEPPLPPPTTLRAWLRPSGVGVSGTY